LLISLIIRASSSWTTFFAFSGTSGNLNSSFSASVKISLETICFSLLRSFKSGNLLITESIRFAFKYLVSSSSEIAISGSRVFYFFIFLSGFGSLAFSRNYLFFFLMITLSRPGIWRFLFGRITNPSQIFFSSFSNPSRAGIVESNSELVLKTYSNVPFV